MEWSNQLGLGFFLWLPILIAIYFYRHRPKDQKVSSHFLWRKLLTRPRPTSFFEKFLDQSLFWIQLILFMLLFLALSGPALLNESSGESVVVIIDNSGSMAARDGTGVFRNSSRLDRALLEAREWVSGIKVKKLDVYSWNRGIRVSQTQDSIPFLIAPMVQTHFENGSFETLYRFSRSKRKLGARVLVISDAMSASSQESMQREGVEVKLVGKDSSNWFLSQVERIREKDDSEKLKIRVGKSGEVHSATIFLSVDSKIIASSAVVQNNEDFTWVELRIGEHLAKTLEITVDTGGQDVLKEDNTWILPAGSPQLGMQLEAFPSEESQVFERLVSHDPRILGTAKDQKGDLEVIWVSQPPDQPEDFVLYLQKSSTATVPAKHSFVLDQTSRFTRFLEESVLQPASWESPFSESWTPLVGSASSTGAQAIILGIYGTRPSYYWNLRFRVQDFHELGIPIIWENFVREWFKLRGLSSVSEVGSPRENFHYSGNQEAYPRALMDIYPNQFPLSGLYSKKGSDESVFVRFPVSESLLGPSHHYQEIPLARLPADQESSKESMDLTPFLVVGIITLLLVEWAVFCRGA